VENKYALRLKIKVYVDVAFSSLFRRFKSTRSIVWDVQRKNNINIAKFIRVIFMCVKGVSACRENSYV